MKRQKMLEQRTPMSEDQKKKSAPKVAKKSVGFAEEVDDEEKKNEPVKESQYLPENKPKPILKSSSTFDEPLQGKIEIIRVRIRANLAFFLIQNYLIFNPHAVGISNPNLPCRCRFLRGFWLHRQSNFAQAT